MYSYKPEYVIWCRLSFNSKNSREQVLQGSEKSDIQLYFCFSLTNMFNFKDLYCFLKYVG